MLFKVVWADVELVEATDASAAWSQFCSAHPEALKHPNLHDRLVFLADAPLTAIPVTPAVVGVVPQHQPTLAQKFGTPPVAFEARQPESPEAADAAKHRSK